MRIRSSEKVQSVRRMREEGKTVKEIADALRMTKGGVYAIIRKFDIQLKETTATRICGWCGNQFTYNKAKNGNKKYCCEECQRKAGRTLTKPNDDVAKDLVKRVGDEWEYAGGYTGSDGFMNIKHKPCGSVIRKSCVSIRKSKHIKCNCCIRTEAETRRIANIKKLNEIRQFNRPIKKHTQIEMKECIVCGSLYVSSKRRNYCSDVCLNQSMKHYSNMKKEARRKQSYTHESRTISLSKLYERDGGVCWICGGLCDIDGDPNSNGYASIDHVKPISKGGKDQWNNIRLAHRLCNSMRGNAFVEPTDSSPISLSL